MKAAEIMMKKELDKLVSEKNTKLSKISNILSGKINIFNYFSKIKQLRSILNK